MKILVLFICLILLSFSNTTAQSWDELCKKVEQYYDESNYDTAISYAEKLVKQCEIEFGEEHQNYVISLNKLAQMYRKVARYDDALPLYLKALESTKERVGKNHPDYGTCLDNLSQLYEEMGRYEEALPLSLEALKNTEQNSGKDDPSYAIHLNTLALIYRDMGRYEEALPLSLEALENTEKCLGKDHPYYGIYLNTLARLYQLMNRYEDSIELYSEALENVKKSYGEDDSYYGFTLSGLGLVYEDIGRYDEALPLYMKALENAERSLGKDHPYYGVYLNNLALLYKQMGRYGEALPLSIEALSNIEKSLGKNHPYYGIFLNNLAYVYRSLRLYDKALPLCLEALKNTEGRVGKDHYFYGSCLYNLSELYQEMSKYEKALPLSIEALENTEKSLGKDNPKYGDRLINLARLYQMMGIYEKALPLYLSANKNFRKQIKSVFSISSEKEKSAFLKTLISYFDIYQSFQFITSGKYSEMAEILYNNQLVLKGLILASSENTLDAIRLTTELYNQWIGLKRRLAEQYSKPINERVSNLDSLETEANNLEGRLVNFSKDFMVEKKKEEITWKDVKDRLYRDDIAIEFTSFRYFNKRWTDSTFYTAYVVTSESRYPEMVYLFEERDINKIINQRSPKKIYSLRGMKKIVETGQEYTGEDLYSLIIKPLEKYLKGKRRIYFSTDGILHQLSFAAFSSGDGELLCDKYDLVQLNSTVELALEERVQEKEPVLLVGGIKYEYTSNQTNTEEKDESYTYNILEDESIKQSRSNRGRGMEWNYLPGTETEIENLEKIYEKNGLSADTLTGLYATEESIKQLDGNSPRVLHIATHGFFFENPDRDKDKMMISLDEKRSYIISQDPLMRSGLILAGANYAWKNGSNPYEKEDGILTAYEISNLNLMKTDLVVLSACETGLGDIEGSEGVYGLQRAFRMAGVEKIIMSLWQVPDKETVEFMETFYSNWLGGQTIREAFNNTQKEMSKKYKEEPEKWAAFVLLE